MSLSGSRQYVGFGFGAIQAGLLLYEAYQSGSFSRLTVAEVMPDVVEAIRSAGGRFTVNIAQADRVENAVVGPVDIRDPAVEADRAALIEAVAAADEIGTAVPSVRFFQNDTPGSIHRILAEGLRRKAAEGGPRAVIYTAENHNHAAEILEEAVFGLIPEHERTAVGERVRFLNTVIGKMSGLADPDAVIAPLTPGSHRAFLVEAFNRILISRINFADQLFERGIGVFVEKADLLPFEEAKLYGHNAVHALAAYLAQARGLTAISDLRDYPEIMTLLRKTILDESGAALIRKYAGLDDLFTPAGFAAYVDDLLPRMTNPYLKDAVTRVGRDPQRKLGWDDRLIGALRLALRQGIMPRGYALGAVAALAAINPAYVSDIAASESFLRQLWQPSQPDEAEVASVLQLIQDAHSTFASWLHSGFTAPLA